MVRGAIREMHWHKEAEWAYMINGSARITAVDQNGQNFADDVAEGDLWYLADGCEFLLVFDDGEFLAFSVFTVNEEGVEYKVDAVGRRNPLGAT